MCNIWAFIDNDMQTVISKGKKFAFGIKTGASSSTPNKQVCPSWVFAAGASYTTLSGGTQKIPVWNDPVYIQKKNNFINALAARYDGNPNIAYVDMRSYGNWGENHFVGIPQGQIPFADWKSMHIDPFANAFTQTVKYVCSQDDSLNHTCFSDQTSTTLNDAVNYAVSKGYSVRWDGSVSNISLNPNPLRANAGNRPGLNEWFASYTDSKNQFGLNNIRKWIPENISVMKPSYFALSMWSSDVTAFYNENSDLIKRELNRLGYHFVLTEASYPSDFGNGTTGTITLKVKNKGVDKIHIPAYLKLALLDSSNNVLKTANLTNINASSWAAGQTTISSQSFSFPYTPGAAKLALGLFTDASLTDPDIKLGNDNKLSNNWYVLSDMPKTPNPVLNSSFDANGAVTQTPSNWYESITPDASLTSNTVVAQDGTYYLAHHKSSSAYNVATWQDVSVANGTYTLKAMVRSSGGQNICVMKAKNFDGAGTEKIANVPTTSVWTEITITGINVQNGNCRIVFHSDAPAGKWATFDNVRLIKD